MQMATPMHQSPVEVIPLEVAVLCVDCEMVTQSKQGHCLHCGSFSLLNLAGILNRETGGEPRLN